MSARFLRLAETARPTVTIIVDGRPVQALQGDTLLVAMLCAGGHLRNSEFGDGARAGFCLMGACQDCWVWTANGERVRACSVPVSEGVSISTKQPESAWSHIA
jgi:NADH dehydrogenase/NADH:ubiquinone oxidoreductase subunit G